MKAIIKILNAIDGGRFGDNWKGVGETARAEYDELCALLKESEWVATNELFDYCWSCGGHEPTHTPDCRLAKALECC
jgi:hypothetical protein